MIDFTEDEITLLVQDGYTPGFMGEIKEGYLVAIPPVMRSSFDGTTNTVKTYVITKLMKVNAPYMDPSEGYVPHEIINFIGIDLNNLPKHGAYGNDYPCFYKVTP